MKGLLTIIAILAPPIGLFTGDGTGFIIGIVISAVLFATGLADNGKWTRHNR